MSLQHDTVAIPVTKGVDITSPARLQEAPKLLEAQNSRFPRGGGATKRRGHVAKRLRSGPITTLGTLEPSYTPPTVVDTYFTGDRAIPSNWLFGWGTLGKTYHATNAPLETAVYPDAGPLFGQALRDNELISWNGHGLYSTSSNNNGDISGYANAVMPALRSEPVAKFGSSAQHFSSAVDNGLIKCVTWVDTAANRAYYTVQDSVTGAVLVHPTVILATNTYRCFAYSLGTFVHMALADTSNARTVVVTFESSSPSTLTTISLGSSDKYFDVFKESESTSVVAINVSNVKITIKRLGVAGNIINTFDVAIAAAATLTTLSVTAHPRSGNLALAWRYVTAGLVSTVKFGVFTPLGTAIGSPVTVTTGLTASIAGLSVVAKYLNASSAEDNVFDIYVGDCDVTNLGHNILMFRFNSAGTIGASPLSKVNDLAISSQAFRVGDRTFVWAAKAQSPISPAICVQKTWILLDETLRPVGHMDFANANPEILADPNTLSSLVADPRLYPVNWSGTAPAKDRCVFSMALGFAERTASTNTQLVQNAIYDEPAIKFVRMDFLPRLRWAQAGRTTYFAGAQVWAYDGSECVEAGFHTAPELAEADMVVAGGALTVGDYWYRIDCCYRNAEGEEVRSWSLYTPKQTVAGVNKKITLQVRPVPTRRTGSYLLFWRNIVGGTTWYLANSRDPTSIDFVKNDLTATILTWTDEGGSTGGGDGGHGVSDANIQNRELYPGNVVGFLDPIAAPACEVIAAGRDRVWVAGGELGAGEIAPSRIYEPGETPAWNPFLGFQVDRSAAPMTAIGFVGDVGVLFRKTSTYLLDSDGPDNVSVGSWNPPRLAYADLGAVSQESLGLLSGGLAFQSPTGFRAIGPSGALQTMGIPVDLTSKTVRVVGTVVSPGDQEIRWYSPDSTLVFNYLYNVWTVWTTPLVTGAVRDPVSGLARLSTGAGELWSESDGVWLDGGRPYEHRVRFPWLHGGNLGDFQRIYRVLLLGEWDGVTPHQVQLEWYYDEKADWEEIMTWSVPADGLNTDTWGANSWGAGTWGDTADGWLANKDSVWRFRKRPHRQKCSVFSIALSDRSGNAPGWVLNAIGLQLGRLRGLDRGAATGGTSTFSSPAYSTGGGGGIIVP